MVLPRRCQDLDQPPGRNRFFLPRELLVPPPPPEQAPGTDLPEKAAAMAHVASWGSGEKDRKRQSHFDISLTTRCLAELSKGKHGFHGNQAIKIFILTEHIGRQSLSRSRLSTKLSQAVRALKGGDYICTGCLGKDPRAAPRGTTCNMVWI